MAINPTPPKIALRLVIRGRGQGVFYRNSVRHEAQKLGVAGWVRNRSDGTAEAMVHGTSATVDAIVRWFRRGSEFAQVEQVKIEPEPAEGNYTSFEVIG